MGTGLKLVLLLLFWTLSLPHDINLGADNETVFYRGRKVNDRLV
jgi:hypothetical protein